MVPRVKEPDIRLPWVLVTVVQVAPPLVPVLVESRLVESQRRVGTSPGCLWKVIVHCEGKYKKRNREIQNESSSLSEAKRL